MAEITQHYIDIWSVCWRVIYDFYDFDYIVFFDCCLLPLMCVLTAFFLHLRESLFVLVSGDWDKELDGTYRQWFVGSCA